MGRQRTFRQPQRGPVMTEGLDQMMRLQACQGFWQVTLSGRKIGGFREPPNKVGGSKRVLVARNDPNNWLQAASFRRFSGTAKRPSVELHRSNRSSRLLRLSPP